MKKETRYRYKGGKINMKLNKGLFAMFAVALLGVGLVSAYGGWFDDENHKAVQSAIADGDYDSWVQAHEALLTEENFNLEVERYESMTEIRELMDQLREARQDGDENLIADLEAQILVFPESAFW